MEFLSKCLFFSVLIAMTYGRSVTLDREALNSSEGTPCSCGDERYQRHYEAKGCVPEAEDACGCPRKFICPPDQALAPQKVCVYRNKEYKVGSKIATSDACQACRCRGGVPPRISCATRECAHFPAVPGENCHLVYEESKCCPTGLECVEEDSSETTEDIRNKTCEYNGQSYPIGSKIYPEDDPCQICVCDENWNGIDNSSCYEQDCLFEKNKSKLNAGCIPVYHEKRCCPIEFYCPSSHNLSYSELPNDISSSSNNASYDNHCSFAGQFYELGEELSIGNPCVKCQCTVPPDFTCVHQTCPPPPNEDSCYAIYNPKECCPSYECMLGEAPVPIPDGCPTPICADSSCHIETPPGHECPTCVCDENISELEHNNLEQVQQISQNFEQIDNAQQVFEPLTNDDDESEDSLQMMPLRVQNSVGQSPVLEKMILPESESNDHIVEGLRELEESSVEDTSSVEAVAATNTSEKVLLAENENSTLFQVSEMNDTFPESVSNQSEKEVHRRSEASELVFPIEQNEGTGQEFNGDIEREGIVIERNDESFEGELENFRKKLFDKNGTIINEIITINHTVRVPPGCPTPLCEGPWCHIGIPEGHQCPTCICKRHIDNEP